MPRLYLESDDGSYLRKLRRRLKNKPLGRFNYWFFHQYDPLYRLKFPEDYDNPLVKYNFFKFPPVDTTEGDKKISDLFKKRYDGGDKEIIFYFVRRFRKAIHTKWVVDQIEEWRRLGNKESRKNLKRLFDEYRGETRGKPAPPPKGLIETIERDQRIFKRVVKVYILEQELVRREFDISDTTKDIKDYCIDYVSEKEKNIAGNLRSLSIKEIYDEYNWQADRWHFDKNDWEQWKLFFIYLEQFLTNIKNDLLNTSGDKARSK